MDNAMASAGVASVNKTALYIQQFIRKLAKFESEFVVHQGPGADGTIPSSRIFTRGELACRGSLVEIIEREHIYSWKDTESPN